GTISEVRIEGKSSIPVEQIRAKIKSHAGSPLDQRLIEADLKSLLGTKWFSDVSPYYDDDPKGKGKGKGYILIFAVKEMPVLSHVEFLGQSEVKLKDIEEATGLKKGARADAMRARLAVEQILTLYHDKGYDLAEVKLVEGGKPGDTRVVIRIFEGPWHKVGSIDFQGNTFASDGTLETKITSRSRLFGLFRGKYHRDDLEEDARKLRDYYQGLGFFDVKVTPVTRPGSTLGDVRLTFVISEGVQYRVRKVVFEGNKKIPKEKLLEGMTLHSGQPFRDTMRDVDRKTLISKYYAIGCIDTQILPVPNLTDEVGVVDLVYKIEEGETYYLGFLDVRGNERTRDKVIRREAVMAGLLPGEVFDLNRLETFQKRLNGLQYFNAPPGQGGGKPIEIKVINRRPHNKPYGDGAAPDPDGLSLTRMQDPGPEIPLDLPDSPPPSPSPAPRAAPASEAPAQDSDRRARSTRPPIPCRRSRSRPVPSRWALLPSSNRRARGRRRLPSARESRRPRSRAPPA
ncbi:MAG: POTRA domain-containing protein, partial [Singulisphaera sp.]